MLSPRTSSRALAGVGTVLALTLTACSSGSSTASSPSTTSAAAAPAATTSAAAAAAATSATAAASATSAAPAATAAATSAPSTAAATSAAPNTAKTQLTFWSWVPNIAKVVALWNSSHPDIHVTVNTQAQGAALYTKLTTADKAGNPPDVFQAEYQELPTLVSDGTAADITKLLTPATKADFTTGTWGLTSFSGDAYGIPQDTGPMMLFYRADLFKQYGLAVPTTWDQYAAEAKTLHAAHPGVYLGAFSANDPGWFAGLAQQARSAWWSTSGDTWTVGINDAASQKVASYWGDLVNAGDIQAQPFFTPAWNAELAKGTLLTWPSAVWAPGVLSGGAPKTQGDWQEVALPAWTAGDTHVGFWGGSSTAVASKSKNQAAAVEFASWLNTDPTAVQALVTQGALYPASIPGQKAPALAAAPAFLSNEPAYYQNAAKISSNAGAFTFGPDVNVTYTSYSDAFGKAITNKSSFLDALTTMQTTTVADMKKSGFKTTG